MSRGTYYDGGPSFFNRRAMRDHEIEQRRREKALAKQKPILTCSECRGFKPRNCPECECPNCGNTGVEPCALPGCGFAATTQLPDGTFVCDADAPLMQDGVA